MKRFQDTSQQLSVLVIEDKLGDFVLIEDYLLEKFKLIDIVHLTDYADSIVYLQKFKEKVSVILLDLHLPDLKGMELINGILAYNFRIPIIILTGYTDLAMAKKSLQSGVSDYLIKDEINPVILHKTIIFARNRNNYINQIELEKLNYENLFNFSPQPTWVLDSTSLKILNANIAAQKKYGYSWDEFLNMSFSQLHPKGEKQLIQQMLTTNEVEFSKNYFTHLLRDGLGIKVDIHFRKIKNISNGGLIVQSNDISDTLKHIETIEIQNAKLMEIAWTQSHEVRAPIARILGIMNLMEDNMDNLDELLFWVKQLRISTTEVDDIVRKIVSKTSLIEQE